MAHNIPKIQWDVTDVTFEFPPSIDDGDAWVASSNVSTSLSGVRQVSINHIEIQRHLTFDFVSEAIKSDVEDFLENWGLLGKQFKYFDDQNSGVFAYYELAELKYNPAKTMAVGANAYVWKIPLAMRRVLGIAGEDEVGYTIANNQSSATNVTGLLFDHTQYSMALLTCELRRTTATQEKVARVTLTAIYNTVSASWDVTTDATGDDCEVTFSITNAGQIQYTSSNLTGGSYVGTLKVKQSVFSA